MAKLHRTVMSVLQGTSWAHRKLRYGLALLAITAGGCFTLPAAASAQQRRLATQTLNISGIPVSDGSGSVVEPALSPAPNGANSEWVAVGGSRQELLAVNPTGQKSTVATGLAADAGLPDNFASVDADGYDWVLDNDQGQPENVLYAVGARDTPNPGLNVVATFNGYAEDMTLGPDGALYISDNAGNVFRCQINDTPAAVCTPAPIGPPFDGGAYAIGNAGGSVWFTDAGGDLGSFTSIPGSISGSGQFGGPLASVNNIDPGTIVAAGNGLVYVAGGGAYPGAANTEIVAFSAGGTNEGVVAGGLGNVVAMTLGPDGNLWFLDAGGTGSVDQLNLSTDAVSVYALGTNGLYLPRGDWRIAPGPAVPSVTGTGELFFTATTAPGGAGSAEIGEVSGIPFPTAPGSLAFRPAVSVSKRHTATLTMTCAGQGNAQCTGKILLSVEARLRLRAYVHAARKGGKARSRTITQTARLVLGSVSYALVGGGSQRATVKLSNAAYKLLEQVVGHRWNATVTSAATVGTVAGTTLAMTGPTPPRPRPAPKPKPKRHRA